MKGVNMVSKRDKKILFVLPTLNMGGAEKVTVNIMNSLDTNKFDVTLLVIDNRYKNLESFIHPTIKLTYLNITRTRYAFFALLREIRSIKPDIVFSSLNRTNIMILLLKMIYPFFKVVIREPSMPSLQLKNGYMSQKGKFLIQSLYPFASKVIAQTKYMKEDIESTYKIAKTKVVAINNPLDKQHIQKQLDTQKNPFKTDEKCYNFVYVGRLSEEKNLLWLVDVFQKVVQKDRRYHLYIIGDGYMQQDIENRVNEYGLQENIKLLGFKKNPYPYIKYSDVLLLTSKWEGMPNVVLEALYLKTPVITTNSTPILKELIVNGQNGYLVDGFESSPLSEYILKLDTLSLEFNEIEDFDFNRFFDEL